MSSLSEPRRPRLLAQNRKLRHLQGISLRNLAFAPTHLTTADDAALGSPSKLGVLRETQQLHQSRSSESLRKDSLRAEKRRPQRPRKTSLSLAHANSGVRQRKLETYVDGVVGDVFFSLHVDDAEAPVYISEVRERSANFDFQFFDLGEDGADISRSSLLTLRVWARRPKQPSWGFLLEQKVDLRLLNFIGTLLDRRFPPNALVFHLEDGLYSLDFPNRIADPKQASPIPTSSYNALMKLANLESSIEDAMQTQYRIMEQINEILESTPADESDTAREEVVLADKYVATQQRAKRTAEKRRDELRESIKIRKAAMGAGQEVQAKAEEDITNNREKLEASRERVDEAEQQIRGQRRRICSELSDIFPITPIPNAPPLSFQICDIPLPNSVYNAAIAKTLNEDALSAGLGLATLLVKHLSLYLAHPLPYPLFHYGSRSFARDDISQLSEKQSSQRDFPLYLPRGGSTAGQWRFEYGWFLLNKNIEALCSSQGLKVVDIRHSLPNLKYLLYVCSAGSDEVPERKKGGVRGLWAGRIKSRMSTLSADLPEGGSGSSSAAGSRRGSVDSEVMNQHGDALRSAILHGSAVDDEQHGLALPFAESETKFTLRTKGLRENVSR